MGISHLACIANLVVLGCAARALVSPAAPAHPRIDVEWPQFARNAAHDGYDAKRKDGIRSPAVLWRIEDCFGQPTLSGGDLYSGGRGLFHIDPLTGAVLARVLGPAAATDSGAGREAAAEAHGLPLTVAGAPAIAGGLVLARRLQDGGVTAFDRRLAREVWSWTPETVGAERFPGCLAGELFLVPHGNLVIALRLANGAEAWRFSSGDGGDVNMVPACDGGRVFFGAESGLFFALSQDDGRELWRTDTGGWLGWTNPVVVKDRVLFGDRGSAATSPQQRRGQVHALSVKDGKELWKTEFGATGFSTPGVGPGYVVAGFGSWVARFKLTTGSLDEGHRVRTGKNAFGSPTVVGESLVFGNLDGNLYVHELDSGALRWRFHLAAGEQVHDFVHDGERIFVSSTDGLYCLGNDRTGKPAPRGFVLEGTAAAK